LKVRKLLRQRAGVDVNLIAAPVLILEKCLKASPHDGCHRALSPTCFASYVFKTTKAQPTPLAEQRVQVVTPPSPLGRPLMGKRTGDEVEIQVGERTREMEIVRIA
jgi:hypothetical protein